MKIKKLKKARSARGQSCSAGPARGQRAERAVASAAGASRRAPLAGPERAPSGNLARSARSAPRRAAAKNSPILRAVVSCIFVFAFFPKLSQITKRWGKKNVKYLEKFCLLEIFFCKNTRNKKGSRAGFCTPCFRNSRFWAPSLIFSVKVYAKPPSLHIL